jgi:iron complex outermembrane receptor protein
MHIKYFYILYFTFFVSQTFAQECSFTISGRITDSDTKEPLSFASVYVKETGEGTTANENGYYQIENVCKGIYIIECSHLGCHPYIDTIAVNENVILYFSLPHFAHQLEHITICEEKTVPDFSQPFQQIKGKDLEILKGGTLGDVIKSIPGITNLSTGSSISKPMIHGLHSNRILIFENGIRLESQQWGSEHAPEIDPFIAEEISLIKDAGSLQYGSDALGGVLLIDPHPMPDSLGISGDLSSMFFSNNSLIAFSGMLQGRHKILPAFSWRIQGTFKKGGNIQTPDYVLKNTGLEEYNFSWTMSYTKPQYGLETFYSQFNTNIAIFTGSHIGNLTDLMNTFEQEFPSDTGEFSYEINRPYQHIEHELIKAKFWLQTGNAGKLQMIYGRQYNLRQEYDKDPPLNDSLAALNYPEIQYEITTHSLDVNWEHNPFHLIKGQIGINGMMRDNTYEYSYFIPNYENYTAGIYWIERWYKNQFQLEGGIRYDYKWLKAYLWYDDSLNTPSFNWSKLSFSLGQIYSLNEFLKFSIHAGSAWRTPSVNELFSDGVHHGAASYEIGDSALNEEQAYSFTGTLNYSKNKIRAQLSLYYNAINDFIYLQPVFPATLTISGAFPTFQYKQANVSIKGIDAFLSLPVYHALSASLSSSMLRAWNITINDYLIMMPADRAEVKLQYDFKPYKKLKDSFINFSFLTVAKQTRVPDSSDYVISPDAYSLLGAEAGFTISMNGNSDLFFAIKADNLLNTAYRDYLDRFRYYCDAMGRNISLKLKFNF